MIAANSVSSGVSCVPPPCGRTLEGGISGFAISHNPSGTTQLHVPRPMTRPTTPHHIGHALRGASRSAARRGAHILRHYRQVINGTIHRLSSDCQWRKLPERLRLWQTIHKCPAPWSAAGPWERLRSMSRPSLMQRAASTRASPSTSTSIWAHQHAAGAPKDAPAPRGAAKGPLQRSVHLRAHPPAPLPGGGGCAVKLRTLPR